jgi:hypothetical protein
VRVLRRRKGLAMTAQPRASSRRPPADRLTSSEIRGLMRRGYVRPIGEPPSLMQMAKRRTVPAGTDSQAVDNTTTERNAP